jgi:hypothetical protein
MRSFAPAIQAANLLPMVGPGVITSGRPYIAATRSRFSDGTPNAVSVMPKGSNRRSRRKSPSGRPEITSITRAATSMPTL